MEQRQAPHAQLLLVVPLFTEPRFSTPAVLTVNESTYDPLGVAVSALIKRSKQKVARLISSIEGGVGVPEELRTLELIQYHLLRAAELTVDLEESMPQTTRDVLAKSVVLAYDEIVCNDEGDTAE
jgi:hypothetical protein